MHSIRVETSKENRSPHKNELLGGIVTSFSVRKFHLKIPGTYILRNLNFFAGKEVCCQVCSAEKYEVNSEKKSGRTGRLFFFRVFSAAVFSLAKFSAQFQMTKFQQPKQHNLLKCEKTARKLCRKRH